MECEYETPCFKIPQKLYIKFKLILDKDLNLFITNFLGPIVPKKIRQRAAQDMVESGIFKERKTLTLQCCMTLQVNKHSLVQNYKLGLFNE